MRIRSYWADAGFEAGWERADELLGKYGRSFAEFGLRDLSARQNVKDEWDRAYRDGYSARLRGAPRPVVGP